MKKLIQLTLLLVAILLPANTFAYSFKSGSIYYNIISSSDKTVQVTYQYYNRTEDTSDIPDGYVYEVAVGDDYTDYFYAYSDYSGQIVIPSTVYYNGNTYQVTGIGNWAFANCRSQFLTIPSSVTYMGQNLFDHFTGSLTVNCSTLRFQYQDGYDYYGNPFYVSYSPFEGGDFNSLTLGDNVTAIPEWTFNNCSNLINATLSGNITTIGYGAFSGCSKLSAIDIDNTSLSSIGFNAFAGCYQLKVVNISNLKRWLNCIFDGTYASPFCNGADLYVSNSKITNLSFPVTTISIPSNAFYGCSSLTSITIPNYVNSIGINAFSGCSELTSITVEGGNTAYDSRDDCNAIIEQSTNTLILGCQNSTIPNSVTSISNYAFYNCSGLTSISIPNSVTTIDNYAFQYCSALKKVYSYIEDPSSITMGTSVFHCDPSNYNSRILYVPTGSSATYQADTKWSQYFGTIVEMVDTVLATSIELDVTNTEVTEGETLQLTATVMPEDATDKSVTWASSDEAVATVDQNGLVTAVAPGTATITATTIDGSDLSATCEVTVNTPATASNSLDADALSAYCGEEKQLAVRMDNESSITALQCDIYLPEGISIATDDGDYLIDLVPARRATNHTVSTNDLPNGAIRLFITSATSKPFKGNSGDLFILNLIVDENAESGEYSIDLRNVILSDTEAHPYYVSDLNVPVTVLDYIKGDVNIDGTVNVSDYVATANYILEMDPHPFLFAAADIDENQTINVSDLVGVANIALNFMGAPAVNRAPAMGYDGVGTMAIVANGKMIATDRYAVTLDLSNSSAVTAFQMDVNLPNGMKLVGATLSNRASSSHSLEMNELANGAYRLLGASMMSKTFAGNEGTLLTLEIEGSTSGMAVIDGIMLAEPDATLHRHDAIILTFDDASGVHEMYNEVRIYTEDGKVVVESPIATKVQFILPNGMSLTKEVKSGRNVYDTGFNGVVIVKVDTQVKKFKL